MKNKKNWYLDLWQLEQMRKATVEERFRHLYSMQQMTRLLHPPKQTERKLVIKKWSY